MNVVFGKDAYQRPATTTEIPDNRVQAGLSVTSRDSIQLAPTRPYKTSFEATSAVSRQSRPCHLSNGQGPSPLLVLTPNSLYMFGLFLGRLVLNYINKVRLLHTS